MMQATQAVEPIRKNVTVNRPVEDAFRLFTEGMSTWWPLEVHSIAVDEETGKGVATVVFEPKGDGRVYEVADDGTEFDWAKVLVWEPPGRFVLAWKPNLRSTPPTELEVRFSAHGKGTRVELEHRGWERLGELADEARSGYDGGWPGTLERFAKAANQART